MAYSEDLLNLYTEKPVSWVRIPPFLGSMYLFKVLLSFIESCLTGLFSRQLRSWRVAMISTSGFSLFSLFVYIKLTTWINSEVLNHLHDCITANSVEIFAHVVLEWYYLNGSCYFSSIGNAVF